MQKMTAKCKKNGASFIMEGANFSKKIEVAWSFVTHTQTQHGHTTQESGRRSPHDYYTTIPQHTYRTHTHTFII